MIQVIRSVWPLFFALALIMVGNGLQGSLLSLRATIEGFNTSVTGLVMSAYYGGFVLSSVIVPRLIAEVGHIRVFAGFASIASTTVLLHALFPDPIIWLFMRFMTGFALAGLYVVAESWLNAASTNETRGRMLGLYMTTMYACMAFGQYLLGYVDPAAFPPFILISVLVSMALVPIALTGSPAPQIEHPEPVGFVELYRISPLGFMACLLIGVSQGAMLGMGAVYGSLIGLSAAAIGVMLALAMIAVVVTQYPIGFISDRVDRRWVIFAVNALVGGCALAALLPDGRQLIMLIALFTAYGGLSAPIYSLALAHTNDNLEPGKLLGGSARLVFVFGIGSVLGPVAAGVAMSWFGPPAFFVLGAAAHLFLAAFTLYRMTRRPAVPLEDRGDFIAVGVRATAVAAGAAMEEGSTTTPEEVGGEAARGASSIRGDPGQA